MMTARLTDAELSAIASDLARCEIGVALTRGKLRRRYLDQRAACLAALKADAANFEYEAVRNRTASIMNEIRAALTLQAGSIVLQAASGTMAKLSQTP